MSKKTINESAANTAAEIMNRIKSKHGVSPAAKATRTTNNEKVVVRSTPKAQPKADKPAAAPKPPKEMPLCACGCEGRTKGGTYLPGHDSKHRAALAGPKVMPDCGCGCGAKTKGGRFLPGHDAKFYSAQRKAEKEAADAKAAKKPGKSGGKAVKIASPAIAA